MKNRDIAMRQSALSQQKAKLEAQRTRSRAKTLSAQGNSNLMRFALLMLLSSLLVIISWSIAQAQEIQSIKTKSGIEVWLVEDHTVPIIAMDFSFTGGTAQDVDGKEGTLTMLTSLFDEGADDMDSRAFLTALEENAIKLKFDAGRDRLYGSLRTLTPNADLAFDLLAKALQSPRFDKDPVERMRAQWIASARRAETNPDSLVGKTFREAAYPGHPYSRPARGTVASLSAITQDDLHALHRAIVTRDGLTIGVVGAIDAETLKGYIEQAFAPLPEKGDLKTIEDIQIAQFDAIHVPFEAPQTAIRFGSPGIDRQDPDFFAAYLVNHILGGGTFSSRLYNEIREKRGLAYGVYSYLSDSDHTAMFGGGMSTRSDNTEQAVELVKQEIFKMAKEGPTAEELEKAKKFLIGNYPLRFDSSSKISRQLVGLQNEELGIDYFEKRNSYIEAVTLEDTKRVAKRLLDPSKLLMVTLGKQMKSASLAPDAANDNGTTTSATMTATAQ